MAKVLNEWSQEEGVHRESNVCPNKYGNGAVNLQRVEGIRRCTLIFHMTLCRGVHKRLGYQKVCARWVPKQLSDQQTFERMATSLTNVQYYAVDVDAICHSSLQVMRCGCTTLN
ncbi:hypothetical protein PR048_017748 [Dryococelus australis]|uniref:Uncharacterized protein n=1 Tax=Dryococelus australis TaxID=614101 RepID=A0ABQ9HAH2_9NEOP|nr:hypothetical protein PR048_017748 [Dryococelus australis]